MVKLHQQGSPRPHLLKSVNESSGLPEGDIKSVWIQKNSTGTYTVMGIFVPAVKDIYGEVIEKSYMDSYSLVVNEAELHEYFEEL